MKGNFALYGLYIVWLFLPLNFNGANRTRLQQGAACFFAVPEFKDKLIIFIFNSRWKAAEKPSPGPGCTGLPSPYLSTVTSVRRVKKETLTPAIWGVLEQSNWAKQVCWVLSTANIEIILVIHLHTALLTVAPQFHSQALLLQISPLQLISQLLESSHGSTGIA